VSRKREPLDLTRRSGEADAHGRAALAGTVWVLSGARAISALGTGLTLPLTLVYLHQARGISLAVTGELFALAAVAGLAAMPLTGVALDRLGARPVLVTVLIGQALAATGLAWAHNSATAVPVMVLQGASLGPSYPAYTTMMGGLCSSTEQQQRAFGWNFTVVNAAIGIGGAIGGVVVDVRHVATIQALYLGNAAATAVCAGLVARLPNHRAERDEKRETAGYLEVLRIPALRTVVLTAVLLASTGYATLDSGAPAYATVVARVPVRVIPLALTVNTIVIVIVQPLVLRRIRKMRSSRALVLIGVTWAVAWVILGMSVLPSASAGRSTLVLAYAGLFGVGETLMAPTLGPLVNRLAPEHLRGRANSLSQASFSLSLVVAPVFSTALISAGVPSLWIGLLSGGSLGTAVLGLRLRRQLTTAQDYGTSEGDAAPHDGTSAESSSPPEMSASDAQLTPPAS
jgi:MFS family permease